MVLELKGVRKAYGDIVVFSKLDIHIERGDRIALVGPNGAGKSTLMRMLSGEEAPDADLDVDIHGPAAGHAAVYHVVPGRSRK
jgi:ATPase subunit of ABC transporter with duplicated ATPase domains